MGGQRSAFGGLDVCKDPRPEFNGDEDSSRRGGTVCGATCGRTSTFIRQPEMEFQFDAAVADGVESPSRDTIEPGENFEVVTNEERAEIDQDS